MLVAPTYSSVPLAVGGGHGYGNQGPPSYGGVGSGGYGGSRFGSDGFGSGSHFGGGAASGDYPGPGLGNYGSSMNNMPPSSGGGYPHGGSYGVSSAYPTQMHQPPPGPRGPPRLMYHGGRVSLDLVKSLYAKFIDWDKQMVDVETGTSANATNTSISEDLGQVQYILTDKTRTLTENTMISKRCCIPGTFFGNENGDAVRDGELLHAINTGSPYATRFLTVTAICNTVIPKWVAQFNQTVKDKSGFSIG